MPSLRLVRDEERLTLEPPADWSTEPAKLYALAVALRDVVGEEPEPADTLTPDRAAWFERYERASDVLIELSGRDAFALRAAAPGAPDIGDAPKGHGLLIAAALRIERRFGR